LVVVSYQAEYQLFTTPWFLNLRGADIGDVRAAFLWFSVLPHLFQQPFHRL
jgi:hypothetical protein